VVEDDPAVLEGVRGLLELADYHVATAGHGLEALALLETFAPHLIVSDIMMPRMDGYELYAAVRARPEWAEIPFIFLTARAEKRDVYRGKELGVDDYIVKPFDESDLLIAIRNKLTRRAQLDQARQRQIADLKHAIISTLNHEFRTPLTHIASYLELLRETAPQDRSEEFSRFLQMIEAGTLRLQRLVEDFILLAEIRTGEAQQIFEQRCTVLAELPSLLATVVEQSRPAASAKGVGLELRLSPELPAVRADREYLSDAVRRLVENGIKFSPPAAGPVCLETEVRPGWVLIRVIDHGRGIPPSELERIFDLFYQSDRARHEQQGIGAGLTIASEIARMHGGTLSAKSTVGAGSTFTITLPAAA
jgi:signal transduction histidine kinase